MKQQGVYQIRNVTNGKFYVGSSKDIKNRFAAHRKLLRGGRHHCPHLQAAWGKYGEECFIFEVLQLLPCETELFTAENVLLRQHVGTPQCYNAGRDAYAPMRGRFGALHPQYQIPKTEAQKAAISATLKATYAANPENHPRVGTLHTEETRAKISAAKLANPQTPWLGKERSDEVKEKISAAQRGVAKGPRVFTPEGLERARANMKRNAVAHEPKGLESVLAKFPTEVLVAYDFSNAVYTGALSRITGVFCEQHGIFSNYAARFRKGSGCPACGEVRRAASKKVQMLEAWANDGQRTEMLAARKKVAPPQE
jgi:group I intron endonuclease